MSDVWHVPQKDIPRRVVPDDPEAVAAFTTAESMNVRVRRKRPKKTKRKKAKQRDGTAATEGEQGESGASGKRRGKPQVRCAVVLKLLHPPIGPKAAFDSGSWRREGKPSSSV